MQQCTKKRFNAGYAASLNDATRTRYSEKISLIGGVNPYEEMLWDDDVVKWPAITTVHICVYLILYPSPYSRDQMLNYKSLDSSRNFQEGWVREVFVKESVNSRRVVIGKVTTLLWFVYTYNS